MLASMIERMLADPDPRTRAGWFDDLGLRNADSRPGVGVRAGLPDLAWRRVPAGSFWMGGDPLALGAWSGRRIELASDVWLTAYPVTVIQFQCFIDAGGYTQALRSCWSNNGWSWKQRYNMGAGLDAPLGSERAAGAARISNHPVLVTWYDADAFAQWLEQLRRLGRLPLPSGVHDRHVLRLPDEAEREWVARYPDGRCFPWGDSYRIGFANIDETSYGERVGPYYLGRVTPVGLYPLGRQSALDVYDLSGNVDEWCRTCWDEGGYVGDNDRQAVGYRVVRGGHYHNGVKFARAAARSWGDPDPDDQYDASRGFRLAIGPPL